MAMNRLALQRVSPRHVGTIEIVALPVFQWRAYRDLRLRAIQDSPQAFLDTEQETRAFPESKWKQRLADAAAGKSWQLFAKLQGKLVGMIGAYRSEEDIRNDAATAVGLWVAPEARGEGVGRKLMETLVDTLKQRSIKTAHLSVNVEQTAAVALYNKLGFQIVEEQEAVMGDGRKHKELSMEKTLI